MFVCICHAVTVRDVEGAMATGAKTRDQVTRACGAGGDCGSCHWTIERMLEDREELVACAKLVRERAA